MVPGVNFESKIDLSSMPFSAAKDTPGATYRQMSLYGAAGGRYGEIGGYDPKNTPKQKYGPIVGSYDKRFADALNERSSKSKITAVPRFLGKMYDNAGEVSSRVENVNREIVFEQAYKRLKSQFLKEGIDPEVAERWAIGDAAQQGIEVLNFSRHGSNPYVRLLAVAMPFTNAKLQGLKKLGTVATGTGMGVLAPKKGFAKTDIALKKLGNAVLARSFTIMAASMLYELMAMNDDDRDDIPWYRQDSNWLIPTPIEDEAGGTVYANIATPFEAGTLLKLIPSLITRSLVNGQWGKNETRSLEHAVTQTLGLDYLGAQIVKPFIEWSTNMNRFRDSPIVPFYMEKMDPEYQYTDYTSAPAKATGELTGLSPMKLDNFIKTAFGTFGQYALQLTDWVMRMGIDDERYPERSPGTGLISLLSRTC